MFVYPLCFRDETPSNVNYTLSFYNLFDFIYFSFLLYFITYHTSLNVIPLLYPSLTAAKTYSLVPPKYLFYWKVESRLIFHPRPTCVSNPFFVRTFPRTDRGYLLCTTLSYNRGIESVISVTSPPYRLPLTKPYSKFHIWSSSVESSPTHQDWCHLPGTSQKSFP